MSKFQQQGRIRKISERKQISDKFTTRDLVIETTDQYPQIIIFQLSNAKCDQVDNLKVGEQINVHFNLRGREWTNQQGEVKVYNTLDAWKVELIREDAGSAQPTQQAGGGTTDDLPF